MTSARRVPDQIRPKVVEHVDRQVSDLAASQHGVVALDQLAALGLSRRAVSHRAARGKLHRIHRGVYAVGHPLVSRRGRWMAAVLACGPRAALSHAAAAALWELRPSSATRIDVIVPTTGGRARSGLRVHRTPTLRPGETTARDGIRVTTVARTLLDLASSLPRRGLERALDQAEVLELFDLRELRAVAEAHAGERGAARLARALEHHTAGTTLTRSALEERLLAVVQSAGLERPRGNAWVAGLEVDFLFAARRLVVEVDGYRYHRTRSAFERDRERDAILARAGYRVLRFSHRQLTRAPGQVAATIRSWA